MSPKSPIQPVPSVCRRATCGGVLRGVGVKSVERGSAAWRCGIRAGDRIVAVDDVRVDHELDFTYYCSAGDELLSISRGGSTFEVRFERPMGALPGLDLVATPVRRCRNRCVFCFVAQMPRGLRRTLYIRDEDMRHSFLYGNFVTMTDQDPAEIRRVVDMGLSPLYVSVHATDNAVRARLLGVPNPPPITDILRTIERSSIRFHTQIVVCPGINDGAVLNRTIRDLLRYRHGLLSIGVVPLGLTSHRRVPMKPVGVVEARDICAIVDRWGGKLRRSRGARMVYVADELRIKAGLGIPRAGYYEGYPQIENGIGLVRSLLDEWSQAKRTLRAGRRAVRRALVVCSVSAGPFVRRIVAEMTASAPERVRVVTVSNRLFGESVTVAGLMGGRDVVGAVKKLAAGGPKQILVLPSVMFNARGHTLDGWSAGRLSRAVGVKVVVVRGVDELLDCITGTGRGSAAQRVQR